MAKILVTGGAGFIGSHLCAKLLELGHYVVCVDNFFTGSHDNIAHMLTNPNFELIEHDVIDYISSSKIDQIYNLACPASPIHYQYDPIQTLKSSVLGTLNVLEIAKSHNAKILQASTSEVYGDPTINPQAESYYGNVNPIGIRSCYDEGKRCAETLCMDYHRQYNVRIKIVRIFNTYGPNMRINDGRVVSNLIIQALSNKDITIYGDGTQTRSFQYIDNLIDGMLAMMATNDKFVGPVNLGNPNEFTINQLAQQVIKATGSQSQIIFKALPKDDPRQRQPDITLARKMLGYNPDIELGVGLKKTIDYFRSEIKQTSLRQDTHKSNRLNNPS